MLGPCLAVGASDSTSGSLARHVPALVVPFRRSGEEDSSAGRRRLQGPVPRAYGSGPSCRRRPEALPEALPGTRPTGPPPAARPRQGLLTQTLPLPARERSAAVRRSAGPHPPRVPWAAARRPTAAPARPAAPTSSNAAARHPRPRRQRLASAFRPTPPGSPPLAAGPPPSLSGGPPRRIMLHRGLRWRGCRHDAPLPCSRDWGGVTPPSASRASPIQGRLARRRLPPSSTSRPTPANGEPSGQTGTGMADASGSVKGTNGTAAASGEVRATSSRPWPSRFRITRSPSACTLKARSPIGPLRKTAAWARRCGPAPRHSAPPLAERAQHLPARRRRTDRPGPGPRSPDAGVGSCNSR